MRHWVPFDERALTTRLALRAGDLEAYLYNDHHALADLARARGLDVAGLRDELVAPWRPLADDQRYALLRGRTERILTQPHLAQHVFFHVFHDMAVVHDAQGTFGLPFATVHQLRIAGLTPLEIAARGGVPPPAVRASVLHSLALERDEGVRRGVAWPDGVAAHLRPPERPARLLAAEPAPGRRPRQSIRQGEVLARATLARVAPHPAPARGERAPRRAPAEAVASTAAGRGPARGAGRRTA